MVAMSRRRSRRHVVGAALALAVLVALAATPVRGAGVVLTEPGELSAGKTKEKPTIEEQVKQKASAKEQTFIDPLPDLLAQGIGPANDPNYAKILEDKFVQQEEDTVEWLDSSVYDDRILLGHIVAYCTYAFVSKHTAPNCLASCHPKVSCGTQAARFCQEYKGQYKEFNECHNRESRFCHKYGAFAGELYPNFRAPKSVMQDPTKKKEAILEYCGDLFQMRGVELTCLRRCTVFEWKQKSLPDYFRWRVRHRRDYKNPDADPKDAKLADPANPKIGAFNDCERLANQDCRFLPRDYWRECYERVKMQCLHHYSNWNEMIDQNSIAG